RELDWDALDAYVQLGYIPAPATPFHDVRKLEPGHWLLWRETGAVMVHPYWDLPRHETPAPPDIADRLVEWLDDSVAAHLVSDVLFAGYWRHLGLLAMEQFGRLPRALRGAAASLSSFLPDPGRGLGMYRLKRFLRAARDTATMPDRYLGLLGKCDDRERAQLYSADLRVLLPGGAAGE